MRRMLVRHFTSAPLAEQGKLFAVQGSGLPQSRLVSHRQHPTECWVLLAYNCPLGW